MFSFIRRFHLPIFLAVAIAVPYVLVSDSAGTIREKFEAMLASRPGALEPIEGIDDPAVNELLARQQQLSAAFQSETADFHVTPTVSLEGILRFDVNPRWVLEHWPHVSSTRSDAKLDGLRVPVITGTGPHDVLGSLTYYFDAAQQVQRISMNGLTGDDRRLVTLATGVFKLKPEPKAGVGIYVSRWNGKPISALWMRRAPVAQSGSGNPQYEFVLELNRPTNYGGLSQPLQQRLARDPAGGASTSLFR